MASRRPPSHRALLTGLLASFGVGVSEELMFRFGIVSAMLAHPRADVLVQVLVPAMNL